MTEGTSTYEGLAPPLYGEYEQTQQTVATDMVTLTGGASMTGDFLVLQNSDGTERFYIEDDGVTNWTIAKTAADNAVALTLTDSATLTSGYAQGFYVSHTTSGAYSTGSTQINSIAVDLMLGGTVNCEAEGLYIYVAASGSPTLTSGNINGANIYIADLGSAPSSRQALQLHIADGNTASGQDAFISMRIEGASGAVVNMFEKSGTATNPTNFLKTNATDNMVTTGDFVTSGTSTYGLKCLIGGTSYYIPLTVDS